MGGKDYYGLPPNAFLLCLSYCPSLVSLYGRFLSTNQSHSVIAEYLQLHYYLAVWMLHIMSPILIGRGIVLTGVLNQSVRASLDGFLNMKSLSCSLKK